MALKFKYLTLKKFGWKRVAKNVRRFGWDLYDAEQETTTTHQTTYEGTVSDDKVYITPHTTSTTTVRINLSFTRNSDDFINLLAIAPLEILYNIVFLIRRIMGALLPIATVGLFIMMAIGGADTANSDLMGSLSLYWGLSILIWALLIMLEGILARIASKILKYRN